MTFIIDGCLKQAFKNITNLQNFTKLCFHFNSTLKLLKPNFLKIIYQRILYLILFSKIFVYKLQIEKEYPFQ